METLRILDLPPTTFGYPRGTTKQQQGTSIVTLINYQTQGTAAAESVQ